VLNGEVVRSGVEVGQPAHVGDLPGKCCFTMSNRQYDT
jgi:hypothetical protein